MDFLQTLRHYKYTFELKFAQFSWGSKVQLLSYLHFKEFFFSLQTYIAFYWIFKMLPCRSYIYIYIFEIENIEAIIWRRYDEKFASNLNRVSVSYVIWGGSLFSQTSFYWRFLWKMGESHVYILYEQMSILWN